MSIKYTAMLGGNKMSGFPTIPEGLEIKRAEWLQEARKTRFKKAYGGWQGGGVWRKKKQCGYWVFVKGHSGAILTDMKTKASTDWSTKVSFPGGSLTDILCEQFERTVGKDNWMRFAGHTLQIPKVKVRAYRYQDSTLSVLLCGGRAGKLLRVNALRRFPAHEKADDSFTTRTGCFYLLLTLKYAASSVDIAHIKKQLLKNIKRIFFFSILIGRLSMYHI
jgi:hypothetical protein